jgi:Gas vesicle protein K
VHGALRRMDHGTLTAEQTEAVGLWLMRSEETIREIAEHFEVPPDQLGLDLGPSGRLM